MTDLQTDPSAQPSHAHRPPPPEGNLVLSAVGAALGSGLGALIWFGIAYVSSLEFGYIAVLVGAMAGWGAVWLGKVRNEMVGGIAAVTGVLGIFAGSYASYHHGMHIEMAKAQMRQEFYYVQQFEDPEFEYLPAEQKEARFEQAFEEAAESAPGYFEALSEHPFDLMIMVAFGGFGLYYGFRVGSGQTASGVW